MPHAILNPQSSKLIKFCALICLLAATSLMSGCTMNMRDQPRYEALERSAFFKDHRASRQLIEDTVARDNLRTDEYFYTGQVDGAPVEAFPFPVTKEMLERGHERFDIFCSPCHGRLGNGNGMIVQRGFKQPFSFHIDRLREAPPGYFYGAITNGFGSMPSYATRILPEDRWAIVAYVRALQLSQHATLNDVPESELDNLQ